MEINLFDLEKLIDRSLREDIGTGDLTTNSIVAPDATTYGYIMAKEGGVVAGLQIAEMIFCRFDPAFEFKALVRDGDRVRPGSILAEIAGRARAILAGERLALNFLQHMSGIATRTAGLVSLVEGSPARIVDTRKTTPGLRAIEKYAVKAGGGYNHRFGLYDGVLIKDNHIKVAGGIGPAVKSARLGSPHTVRIEVEVEDLAGVREALSAGADIIMLDNMAPEEMQEAVKLIAGRVLVEASGGISEGNIRAAAAAGVDLISVGALTHSVKSLDICLDLHMVKTVRN
ncbi:MAG: carboxylating nicotinate-nucleotide diphosphorylase [Desulfotomaculaceae bacterium]|nr:carboxylating nicotinate-nucleotide diphosphorylase [Desulfotomaculaceae bacterium]